MKFNAKRILLLLLTVCAMIGCSLTTFATEVTPTPGTPSETRGWAITSGGYTLTVCDNGTVAPVTEGLYYFSNDTEAVAESGTIYTFKAGYYYFKNGIVYNNTVNTATKDTPVTFKEYKIVDPSSYVTSDINSANIFALITRANTTKDTTATPNTAIVESNVDTSVQNYSGMIGGKVYKNGTLYTGKALVDGKVYKVTNGVISKTKVTDTVSGYYNAETNTFDVVPTKFYGNGVIANGIFNLYYYKNGVKNTKTGWQISGKNLYYLNKGKAYTGWHALKSYGGGKTKYAYYFEKTGKLRTNYFGLGGMVGKKTNYRYWVQKVNYIDVNRTSHTTTLYASHKIGKTKYKAPLISMICSTSRSATGTKLGKFRLEKTCHKRWFIYTKSNPYHYYQYGTHVYGSPTWFHSTMYETKSAKTLVKTTGFSGYNNLGTNQTTACIRLQCAGARLIYDIACDYKVTGGTSKKSRIPVNVFKSSTNAGPFGKITLKMTTGKIALGTKIDPTDLNYNGFGKANSNAIKKLTPDYSKK